MRQLLYRFCFLILTIALIAMGPLSDRADAQRAAAAKHNSPKANYYRKQVNQGTVGIISGGLSGTYIRMASDLASVLDDEETNLLRILPIPGKGGVSNIRDLLYLKGIDVALVQSDILDHIETNRIFNNIRNRVHYLTQLYISELHVVARKSINSIEELRGKRVNFWKKGSATHITGKTVLNNFGINVTPVHVDQAKGIALLKSGEIDANMLIVGKPSRAFKLLKEEEGLHLLPVPYEGNLLNIYLPSKLTSSDYPGLIEPGRVINTVASAAVLAVYNWPKDHPRHRKVARFIDAFLTKFPQFKKKGRHKKWKQVNLQVKLPGWKRFSYMDLKLRSGASNTSTSGLANEFRRFLAKGKFNTSNMTEQQKEQLFEMFQEWNRRLR